MRLIKRFRSKKELKILKSAKNASIIKRYLFLIIGTLIYATAYNLFFFKNNIVYGGASGISIMTKKFIDPSIMILFLNIFFILLSLLFLGKEKTLDSVFGSILFPIFVKLTVNIGNYIKIDNYIKQLENLIKIKTEKEKGRYIELISKLDALSPLKTLYRGYSITEKDGSVVKSVKQLKSGDNIEIRFNDGSKKAVVK